jgi:hypothetical protein
MRSNHGNYHNRNSDTVWGFLTIVAMIVAIVAGIVLYNMDDVKLKDKLIEGINTHSIKQEFKIRILMDSIKKLNSLPRLVDTVYIKPIKFKPIHMDTISKIPLDSITKILTDSLK